MNEPGYYESPYPMTSAAMVFYPMPRSRFVRVEDVQASYQTEQPMVKEKVVLKKGELIDA